ncbi:MAG: hypothetical protein ACTS2F_06875 [Thainema sp.]
MLIETGCNAYNIDQIAYAEWDEEAMWIDLYYPGAGKCSITGESALLAIDAIKNKAKADEWDAHCSLTAAEMHVKRLNRQDNN